MLTEKAIRSAKPGEKPIRMFDGGGLYLEIAPSGGKWWRFKYRFNGKEKRISFGVYPDVGIAGHKEGTRWIEGARDRREQSRQLLAQGVDPGEERKTVQAAVVERNTNSFEIIAREFVTKHLAAKEPSHREHILRRFERDVFPWVGKKPIAEIRAPELLAVMKRIESRGALETAHRALGSCGQVFRYAVATGRAERDPTGDLRGALPPVNGKHFAAMTEPARVAELLRQMDGYEGSLIVKCALRLAPLVFVRPGELRKALWSEIDLDAGEWRYVVTKTNTPHIVPLSTQALDILRELHPLTSSCPYVFPSARSRRAPMSNNAIGAAFRRMGIPKEDMSAHGFRAMARTILDEVLGVRVDLIEHQLAHAVRDPNGRAYNRTAHLPERRKMMQSWSDYLDGLRARAAVLPLARVSA